MSDYKSPGELANERMAWVRESKERFYASRRLPSKRQWITDIASRDWIIELLAQDTAKEQTVSRDDPKRLSYSRDRARRNAYAAWELGGLTTYFEQLDLWLYSREEFDKGAGA